MKDVDLIYGFHCASAFPLGTIAVTPGRIPQRSVFMK